MQISLYIIAALIGLSALTTISMIGKERKPTTPGQAVLIVLINAAEVVLLILAALRLPG